jgi:hypothetical protein
MRRREFVLGTIGALLSQDWSLRTREVAFPKLAFYFLVPRVP